MGEGEYELAGTSKKGRQRKKQLYNGILQQMEFYFGNSNLTKDRFMAQLLKDDPYVDLKIFMDFNKIKKLNCTMDDIRKAISKSKIIELSEDKEKIRRTKPIVVKNNVDECTIYVENIKVDADHDWLTQLFSDFGKIDYVSIPKYMNNKGNKGFAFVEFEKESDAENALAFFDSIGCKMPSETNPEELKSVKTFEAKDDTDSAVNKITKFEDTDETDDDTVKIEDNLDLEEKHNITDSGKSKLSEESEVVSVKPSNKNNKVDGVPSKKRKLSEEDNERSDKKIKTERNSEDKPQSNETQENVMETEQEDAKTEAQNETVEGEDTETKKKTKKQKKDKKKNYIKELGLQVLSKFEWKKMRNRYLDLQRKKMREFKQYLNRQKYASKGQIRQRTVKEEKGQFPEELPPKEDEVVKLEYVPGVIVKLKLPEPCVDAKKLKNDIKGLSPEVKYVDVPLPAGSEEVFVRFSNPDSAKDFTSQEFPGEKTVLNDDEEKMYWEKIHNDRSVKFAKSTKKMRGRNKLLKKAEKKIAKHIKFEEGD